MLLIINDYKFYECKIYELSNCANIVGIKSFIPLELTLNNAIYIFFRDFLKLFGWNLMLHKGCLLKIGNIYKTFYRSISTSSFRISFC